MDTVEEINGTYFYAGKSNLTASELFSLFSAKQQRIILGLMMLWLWSPFTVVSITRKPERNPKAQKKVLREYQNNAEVFQDRKISIWDKVANLGWWLYALDGRAANGSESEYLCRANYSPCR